MSRSPPSPGDGGVDAIELQSREANTTDVVAADKPHNSPADSAEPSTANLDEYPTGLKLAAITTGLLLSIFLVALDSTILATAIPRITDDFGSIRDIAWYSTAFSVTNTTFQSSWGKAYGYFPMKTILMMAIVVFELGNVVCAIAQDSSIFILGRVISGMGGGGVMSGAYIIIALTVKPQYRPAYMGILGVTFGSASVVGPLMGGALTDGPGWRWCFWVSLPVGAAAALIMVVFFSPAPNPLQETPLKEKFAHTDLGGALLATGALSCFVLAMGWAGTVPWNSAPMIGSLVGFGGLTIAFVANEWYMGPMAMLQSHLFRKKVVVLNLAFAFFLAGVFFPLLYTLPIQFQSINNDTAAQSGVRLIPLVLGLNVFLMVTNALLTIWKHYYPLLVLSALAGTAGVSIIYSADATTSKAAWVGFEILTAAGVGIAFQIPMIANQDAVSRDDIASVTSLSLFMENAGTCLFVACSEAVLTTELVSSLRQNIPDLEPSAVIDAGVTQLRSMFDQPAELAGVLRAYLDGCKMSHTVSIACGVAAAVVSLVGAWPSGSRVIQGRLKKPHMP